VATVLVADDSVLYLRLAERILSAAGYRVLLAQTGQEALQRARAERPDVVLCDVLMPDGDGISTLRELKGDPALRDVPVYLLTGTEDQERFDAARAAGAAGILAKPFAPETVLATVSRHVGA
jgi:CheY-like chemotaxis protein